MKPEDKNRLDKFIGGCINHYLFEQNEVIDDLELGNFDNMIKYFDNEEKRTRTEIDTDNRLKSALVNPDERKIKETTIKKNKERLDKIMKMKDNLTKQKDMQQKAKQVQQTTQTASANVSSQIDVGVAENVAAPLLKRSFAEQAPVPSPTAVPTPAPVKKKPVRVMFDKSSGAPFYVDFSERGFAINDTRLSFELIESALSKEFNIILDHGQGLSLDQVKMQKILKYKDRF